MPARLWSQPSLPLLCVFGLWTALSACGGAQSQAVGTSATDPANPAVQVIPRWRVADPDETVHLRFISQNHVFVHSEVDQHWEVLAFDTATPTIVNGAAREELWRTVDARIDPAYTRLLITNGDLALLHWPSAEVVQPLPPGTWQHATFSPDGRTFAAVHDDRDPSLSWPVARVARHIELRHSESGDLLRRWPLPTNRTGPELMTYSAGLHFSPTAKLLLYYESRYWSAGCGGGDEWISLYTYDLESGARLTHWHEQVQITERDPRALKWGYVLPRRQPEAQSSDPSPDSPDDADEDDDEDADVEDEDEDFGGRDRLASGFLDDAHWDDATERLVLRGRAWEIHWDSQAYAAAPDTYGPHIFAMIPYTNDQNDKPEIVEVPPLPAPFTDAHDVIAVADQEWFFAQGERAGLLDRTTLQPLACVPARATPPIRAAISPDAQRLFLVYPDVYELWSTSALLALGPTSCAPQ